MDADELELRSRERNAYYQAGLAEGRRAERADVCGWLENHASARGIDMQEACNAADEIAEGRHINAAKTDETKNG